MRMNNTQVFNNKKGTLVGQGGNCPCGPASITVNYVHYNISKTC